MHPNLVRQFLLCALFGVVFALFMPGAALAGVYDDEAGATYLQVWVDHREFTGGCGDHARNGYSWYVEPEGYYNQECPKVLEFTLPDDLSNVTKVEIYLDIWRGHNPPSVRFSINDVRNYASPVGASWSRTPLVMELNKADFQPGANAIRVWKGTNRYHVHDIGFRLYYDEGAPILSGVTAPSARLASIAAGATSIPPGQGGALNIDGDRITVTVDNVPANTDFVEVYAFYEGYDEDSDGLFRDWHNRTRNNCQQGGSGGYCPGDPETGLFGTIDHVGTVPTTGSPPYSLNWDIPYVAGQSGVRFKIRAVDIDVDVNDDNTVDNKDDGELVRDAAGGVSAASTIQSDDFNRCTLDTEVWTFINPRNDATLSANGFELQMDVPGGQSHDVWNGGNFAPRIMQTTNNVDFSVDVKFLTSVTQNVQLQGLLVEQDADDFLRFNVQAEGGQVKVLGVDFTSGSPSVKFSRTLGITPVNQPIYLRLVRSDITWQLLYSFDGFDWQNGGSFDRSLEVSTVGAFAGNSGSDAPAYTSVIGYFFLTDAPIEPEDSDATYFSELTIDTMPGGVGTVTGGPAEPAGDDPLCGTPLELLAEPVPGWRLGEWQIVAADQPDQPRRVEDNPLIEQFLRSDTITAHFLQNHYELALVVVDEQGVSAPDATALVSVTPSASQDGYLYNETATSTASDADGWYFDRWSGDLTGTNRVETLTFTGNVNVTANYLRRYTLNVEIVDEEGAALDVNGVTVNPPTDSRGYAPNEVATLLAVPAPGWRFVGWSNELGTDAQLSLPMMEDVTVQAAFARERYTVSAVAVDAEGNTLSGTVPTVSPPSDPGGYIYDEVVTLSAPETAAERQFLRWEWTGDAERVSDTTATAQFKLRGNVAFRAIYAENAWTLTIRIVEGNGFVQTTPDGNRFLNGERVTLTAVPGSDWKFAGWSNDVPPADRNQETVTLVMDADKTIEARFELDELPASIYLPVIRN